MKFSTLSNSCILLLSFVFASCSNEKSFFEHDQVQVMIEIPFLQKTKTMDNEDLSILVYNEGNDGPIFFRREIGGWISKDNNLEKKVLLPSGQYRFLLTKGSFYPDKDYTSFQEGMALKDCVFSLPVSESGFVSESGEFFLDSDMQGQLPWSEVIDCSGNYPRTVERTLVRAVGRVDLLLCKGKKDSEGNIVPAGNDTSVESEDKTLYDQTLEKIKEIQVTVHNTASQLSLYGFEYSRPAAYTYIIGKDITTGSKYQFDLFESVEFGKFFINDNSAQYKRFDGYPYQKGPYLFPSVGVSDLEIIVRYHDFPEKKYLSKAKLTRNQVVFVIVYLLEEQLQIELDTEIIESQLETDFSLEDSGIWH